MSKNLIVEYIPFKPVGSLTEQSGAAYGIPGGFVVQGVLQRAGAKNQNGRRNRHGERSGKHGKHARPQSSL